MRKLVSKLLDWFATSARDLPWRRTLDPYAIWVSEIMLQQTQVSTVIPYFERWMRALPNIQTLAGASEQQVLKLWEGLGYYGRARNLHRAAKELKHGVFPRTYEDILALPGIGPYTAGAICSIAFNQPTPVLDGNVARVLSRVFATNDGLWEKAKRLVSSAEGSSADSVQSFRDAGGRAVRAPMLTISGPCGALNQALMELGAIICTPRQPRCGECPIHHACAARKLGRIQDFPAKPRRPAVTNRRFAVFVYQHNGRYLVRQRPRKVVNARLWEFPNVEVLKGSPVGVDPFCAFKHTITRYRIAVEAFLVRKKAKTAGKWLPLARLEKLPFSSAHRKILVALRTQNAV